MIQGYMDEFCLHDTFRIPLSNCSNKCWEDLGKSVEFGSLDDMFCIPVSNSACSEDTLVNFRWLPDMLRIPVSNPR